MESPTTQLQSETALNHNPRLLLLIAVIGYSLFIAANSFVLREPTLLLSSLENISDQSARAATYIPFAFASVFLGSLALKLRHHLLRLLPLTMTILFIAGTAGILTCTTLLPYSPALFLPSLAILGCYSSAAFLCWISFAMRLNRDDLWLFIIASSMLSTVTGFIAIAIADYCSGVGMFSMLSLCSVILFWKIAPYCIANTRNPHTQDTSNRNRFTRILSSHGSIILSLGSLGFVSSLSRIIFDNVSFGAAIAAETLAVILAGIILLLVAVVAKADINIKSVIVCSVPAVSIMCLLVPLSNALIHCVFLGISTTCFTIGLLLLQLVSSDYGKDSTWLSTATYGIISGGVCTLASLGYFTPLSAMGLETGIPESAIAALICMAALVFSLIAERTISTPRTEPLPSITGNPVELAVEKIAEEFSLTNKEKEILALMASGRDIPSIAKILVVSPNTIRTHSKHIFAKINVHTRQECLDELEKRIEIR